MKSRRFVCMGNSNLLNSSYLFENVVFKIFKFHGYQLLKSTEYIGYPKEKSADFELSSKHNDKKYIVEVKYYKSSYYSNPVLYNVASKLNEISLLNGNNTYPIIVVSAKITDELREKIKEINSNIILIDIENLLFMVQENDELRKELISALEFSVSGFLPCRPNNIYLKTNIKPSSKSKNTGEILKERVQKWVPKKSNYMEYEELCSDVLRYLFDDELTLWEEQRISNDGLYRFDLICKIKDGEVSGFWTTILQFFKSKYILFEFKNYKDPITQTEIYTTDKYLYLKAFRSVGIIISCKGSSDNAVKAMRGTLRENGKLILSLNNDDLTKMIDKKLQHEFPADYLYDKLDKMLIDLEK